MGKTIIIKDMAFGEVNNMYDNTPTPSQFITMFNQAVSKINADASISLPQIRDKSGDKPDTITQEDWDYLIDTNGTYTPLDDYWVRRMIIPYVGYRTEWIEEGANAAETSEAYGDFMMGLREFKNKLPDVIEEIYNTLPGKQSSNREASGDTFIPDLGSNPFSGGLS